MPCYFIANIKITDESIYKKYVEESGEIFSKYNGEYLAVDDNPEVLEGNWQYSRTVIIKFETKNDFKKWYNSPEYQEILEYRLSSSHCDTILVKGLRDSITNSGEQLLNGK
jgi:uncharacterized protein (DUF1330 family)